MTAVRQGLNETGFIDDQNVSIEYRWADGSYDRLPKLAADLVSRPVAVILAAGGSDPARVAKAATGTIPIVFVSAADPVKTGLVSSLNRPDGNVTGVSLLGAALEAKRLELLHDLVPNASTIAALINPNYPQAESQSQEVQAGAARLGVQAIVLMANSEKEVDAAIASLVQQGAGAFLVTQDPFLDSRREQLIGLAERHSLPTIYPLREFVAAGGLISYGTHFAGGFRQAGIYVGKILKGAKPIDLPVVPYVTGSMAGLLILVAFALGATAVGFYAAALDEVTPWFPPQFREGYRPRFVVDGLIWERSFPARARRNYLLSMGFGAAFFCAWRCSLTW